MNQGQLWSQNMTTCKKKTLAFLGFLIHGASCARKLRYNYLSLTAAGTFSGQGVAICLHCVNNLS